MGVDDALMQEVIGLLRNEEVSDVYTPKQLANKLDVSLETLQGWRDARLIGCSVIGEFIFYSYEDLGKFLRDHHRGAEARNPFERRM